MFSLFDIFSGAIDRSNKISNVKTTLQIFYRLKSLDDASKYFQKVVILKPDMAPAKKYLDICISRSTDQNHKSKIVFKGMFDKFAKEDAEVMMVMSLMWEMVGMDGMMLMLIIVMW